MFICAQLHLSICDSRGCSLPDSPLSIDFPVKDIGVGCHLFFHGDLPDPKIEPASHGCPASAGRFLTTQSPGNLVRNIEEIQKVHDSCGFQRRDYEYPKSRELSGP